LVETPENNQHTPFEFSEENKIKVKQIIAKYPPGNQKSAVMPLLDLAQRCALKKKKKKKKLTLNCLKKTDKITIF
jgi:NADH:ubiquinone oxidoreductase subunit E